MATPLGGLACIRHRAVLQNCLQVRHKHVNIKRPHPRPLPRKIFDAVTKPIYLPKKQPCAKTRVGTKKIHPYEQFVIQRYKKVFNESNKLIIVCQPYPVDTNAIRNTRCTLRENGFQMTRASNKMIQHAITGTRYEPMLPLFVGTSDIVFSEGTDVKKLLKIFKKLPDLHILGGLLEDRLLTKAGLMRTAELPSVEHLRGELVSILNLAGGSRTMSVLNSHQQKLSANLAQFVKQGQDEVESSKEETSKETASASETIEPSGPDSTGQSETNSADPNTDNKT